jgi:hypothetical protein
MNTPRLSRKSKFTLTAIVVGTAAVGLANTLPAMADTTVQVTAPDRHTADLMGQEECMNRAYEHAAPTNVQPGDHNSLTVTYYCYD